jgi:pyrroloquinoline quinone biosynthesis protein B
VAELDKPVDTGLGITVTPFAVPGKVPLYLEGENVAVGAESETTVGIEVGDGAKSFFYVPGCAKINEGVLKRLAGAALVFFDGTTFTDGEMVDLGLSNKTAWRMGHVAMSGENGSLKRLASCGIGRKIYVHINNTNPVLIEDSEQRASVARAGWDVAHDGMEVSL